MMASGRRYMIWYVNIKFHCIICICDTKFNHSIEFSMDKYAMQMHNLSSNCVYSRIKVMISKHIHKIHAAKSIHTEPHESFLNSFFLSVVLHFCVLEAIHFGETQFDLLFIHFISMEFIWHSFIKRRSHSKFVNFPIK